MTVPPNFFARYTARHLRIYLLDTIYLRRCCLCNLQTNELRDTGMSRLRRVTRMCSSMLSVNCEKAERATQR